MARTQASDFLHSMRYQVDVIPATGGHPELNLQPTGGQSGFSNVTTPESTTEAVEYKEGNYIYPRKFPGATTVADITLQRGVTRSDSSFWDWCRVVIEGSGEYRADISIKHFHRDTALTRAFPTTGKELNLTQIDTTKPAKTYHVFEAFPIRCKPAGDLDATASEISIAEMDVAYEHFEIEVHSL